MKEEGGEAGGEGSGVLCNVPCPGCDSFSLVLSLFSFFLE